MRFSEIIVKNTVDKLIRGEDYRKEVVNAINLEFLDFALDFFKKILDAKLNDKSIDLTWYKNHFINSGCINVDEAAIFAGMNKKTVGNIYGSAKKEIMLNVANANIDYLENLLSSLENDMD